MLHVPFVVVPADGVPRSISVLAVAGRYCWNHTDRMTSAVSQPYDSCVFAISRVGTPHWARVDRGEYPRFTSIVMYWIPSRMVTFDETSLVDVFSDVGTHDEVPVFLTSKTIPVTRTSERKRERIFFIGKCYILKSGAIIPIPARLARNEKSPSPTTMTPAEAKNRGAYRDCENEIELKERSASTGNVPSAKASMMIAPEKKDPLASDAICIDCVKPHGRKKVATPIRIGT